MKMHREIGGNSLRSIFNIALVGALLVFVGPVFGGKDIKSGYCDWVEEGHNWQEGVAVDLTAATMEFDDLEFVHVSTETIRFNNPGVLAFFFPRPSCDWDGDDVIDAYDTNPFADFFVPTITCGGMNILNEDSGGTNLFAGEDETNPDPQLTWTERPDLGDGVIELRATGISTTSSTTACTLSLDWVGSSDADGPIEWSFNVAMVGEAHSAPSNVRGIAETYEQAYFEWGRYEDSDTNPPAYVKIECTAGTHTVSGYVPRAGGGLEHSRLSNNLVLDGLRPNTAYACTAMGTSASNAANDNGTATYGAKAMVMSDTLGGSTTSQVKTMPRYTSSTLTFGSLGPYKLSLGETVEIDPQKYFMNLAINGRELPGTGVDMGTDDYFEYVRGGVNEDTNTMVEYAIQGNRFVDVFYINTDDNSQAEDLIRLEGLMEGTTNLWLEATNVNGDYWEDPIRVSVAVKVLANSVPRFTVSEVHVVWNVNKDDVNDPDTVGFYVDVMTNFVYGGDSPDDEDLGDCGDDDDANNEINCDEELTFSIGSIPDVEGILSPTRYFEIKEEDESTGKVTTREYTFASSWESAIMSLDDGDEIGIRVTVTDAAGGQDTLDIYVEVNTEGNFPPVRTSATPYWLSPLTESNGGGTRRINVSSRFRDPEGDHLCFEISDSTLGEGEETWATASLGRQPGLPSTSDCKSGELTIEMNLPSTNPNDDNFALLGKYGRETGTVMVRAYEMDASHDNLPTAAVSVNVWLVYGPNTGPSIRSVATVTGSSTVLTTGIHEIDEGRDIRLTFTADDAQPTGDILCWTAGWSCTACTGSESQSATIGSGFGSFDSTNNKTRSNRESGVSHEYDLFIRGTSRSWAGETVNTDYERLNGVYTINLCATDLSGETDRMSFDVKINDVEEAPMFSTPSSSNRIRLYMLVGDYSQTARVRATDGDGDQLTYDANFVGFCPGADLDVDSMTGEVMVTPPENNISDDSGMMTCEIEVMTTDGNTDVYTNGSYFTVTIKNDNAAPMFSSGLSAVTYNHPENTGGQVGGNIRVTDPDAGDTISVDLSGSSYFRATSRAVRDTDEGSSTYNEIIGYDIQIWVSRTSAMDYEADINSFDLTIVVMDEYGGSADMDVRVDLTDVNERPMLVEDENGDDMEIEDQTILVGVQKCVASASDIFFDPDFRDQQAGLFIEATTTRPGDASVSIMGNEDICITGHNVGSGPGRVKVTATDRDGEHVSTTFRVSVEANQMPTVVGTGIPDMTVQENGRTDDIDLTAYFDDGDIGYDEMLTFSYEVENSSIATGVLIDGNMLRIYGDHEGMTMVTVTATDQNDQSVDSMFDLQVVRNNPPVVNHDFFEDIERFLGREYDSIGAEGAFTDEGDTLTWYVSTGNTDVATAAIKFSEDDTPWIVLNLHSPGTTAVTVTVYDSANNEAENSFNLTVLARNDPPMVAMAIDDVEVEEGMSHDVSLDGVFEDEGSLDYEVTNEDENIADAFYRPSANEIRIYGNMTGTTTVVVVATDNIGQTASDSFDVTVVEATPTNGSPVLSGTLDNQNVTVGEPITVSISGVFTDPDGDVLTYTASSSDTNVATLDLMDEDLTISGVNAGSTIFTITATDGEFNVVGEFDVEVETIPVALGSIPTQTLEIGGEFVSLNVSEYFYDQDGDVLTYTIDTSGNAATVENMYADISMTPFTRGSTTVTVIASDPRGRSAMQTFMIEVGDEQLRMVAQDNLAGIAKVNISSTANAIGSRIESGRSDTDINFGFGGLLNRWIPVVDETTDNAALQERQSIMGFSANKDNLDSVWNAETGTKADFSLDLPTLDSMISNNFSRSINGNGGIGSWSAWGTADEQQFAGAGYEGNSQAVFFGLDVQSNESWLFGVTVSQNTAESDYSWGTATQSLTTDLTTILPYFSYEPINGKTSVWGVVGRGSGDAETTVVNADAQMSDLSFNLGMFGGRREFSQIGNLKLAVRGDVAVANLETGEGDGAIDALAARVNRVRAGIEGSFSIATAGGGQFTPFGELAYRKDGGDGLTGNGIEIAGGVRMNLDTLTLEARGRLLATHTAEDFSESGLSVLFNFNPNNEDTGLSFSLAPQWGATTDSSNVIWTETAHISAQGDNFRTNSGLTLTSSLGYGFAFNNGKYLLTPTVDVQDTGDFGKTVLFGTELEQLISGARTMNMKMFWNASNNSDDEATPKLGIEAKFTF